MYSLNVPVPGRVSQLAWELRSSLTGFERLRDEPTLVVKRLPIDEPAAFPSVREDVYAAIRGTEPFDVRVHRIDVFSEPATGPGPVIYLAIDSPELESLHRRLAAAFEPIPDIEGEDYVPHITLARGGDPDTGTIERLCEQELEPVDWTVNRFVFWDPREGLPISDVRLPV